MYGPLISTPPEPAATADVDAWWRAHRAARADGVAPFEVAVLAGFRADRLGYAFASGYVEATRHLLGERGGDRSIALCATEEAGVHPSVIATTLEARNGELRLSGDKTWVTLGTRAHALLVLASRGRRPSGENHLVAALVPKERDGVELREMPPTPFVPEIPHATLGLRDVLVEPAEILPGDGYLDVLKPFRTVEDIFVHGALCGYLVQIARRGGWPGDVVEELLATAAALAALSERPALDPTTHLALAGTIAGATRLVDRCEDRWDSLDRETRERWRRDRPLLHVAGKARAARRERARQILG